MFDFAHPMDRPALAANTALFLSNPFGVAQEWVGISDCLGPQASCRAYDRPGAFTHDARLASQPVHLVAHGTGGYHALVTAIREPSRVHSVTLIDPDLICALRELAPCHQFRGHLRMIRKATDLVAENRPREAAQRVTEWWMGRRAWGHTSPRLQARFTAAMPSVVAEWRAQAEAPLDLLGVVTLDCPVHIVTGRRVRSDIRALSQLLRVAFPDCALTTVSSARGASHLSDPHIVGPLIRNRIVSGHMPCQAKTGQLAA
ncbi:MAG: alpha/beta hydrolase [Pseudomonadota bacterium]